MRKCMVAVRKAVEKTPSVGSGLFERDSLIYWLWMALWTLHFWTVPPKVDKPLTESATLTLTPVLIKEWTCSTWPHWHASNSSISLNTTKGEKKDSRGNREREWFTSMQNCIYSKWPVHYLELNVRRTLNDKQRWWELVLPILIISIYCLPTHAICPLSYTQSINPS